jgi:UDP-N-acetylmuramate: L-alanyl-gamma-D-glutamyl-meso-diaminopimelate ligase
MRMHIIGVATEFMTGIATLAREAGHDVTASDHLIDNKTRRELEKIGVNLREGFNKDHLAYKPDLVVIGKEVDLNNQEVVAVHRLAIPHFSGAEWLEKYVLDEDVIKKIMPTAASSQKSRNPHIPDKPIKHAPKIPLNSHSKTKRVTQ